MLNVGCRCGDTLELPEGMIGEPVDCPSCGKKVRAIAGTGSNSFVDESHPLLSIRNGPDRVGEQFALVGNAPIAVGKLPDHPLSLLGSRVSRLHCRLTRKADRWHVEDNKSTNGLFVNGQRVTTPRPLGHGDVVTVGEFELEFHDPVHAANAGEPEVDEAGGVNLDSIDDAYDVAEEPAIVRPVAAAAAKSVKPVVLGPDAIRCPSCSTKYPPSAQICVNCGINLKTGRAILITREIDENALAIRAENMLRVFSWVARIGIYPISSEGSGSKQPFVTWVVAALIALATIGVWVGTLTHSMSGPNNLMLWAGRTPTAHDIELAKTAAMDAADEEDVPVADKSDDASADSADESDSEPPAKIHGSASSPVKAPTVTKAAIIIHPRGSATPEVRLESSAAFFGQYSWTQLITNGFLHGNLTRWSIFQLIRNIVFLLVFGSAVNALIGQVRMGILFAAVLLTASISFVWIQAGGPPTFTSGANGAVMGLAGAYVVLFPIHKMHIVAWRRKGMRSGFELSMKIFQVRGVWVVLCCVALDILMTLLITRGGIDWVAHLCGFAGGMVCAIILLIARQADANRTDMISLLLGRNSWALLGRPGSAPADE